MQPKRSLPGIELLRVAAVMGVVWFHTDGLPSRRIGFSGLIVFVLLTTIFICQSTKIGEIGAFLQKRVHRLLLPWAFWFAVYAVLNLATGRAVLPHARDPVSAILAGPWIGLWYLPFAFAVSLLVFLLMCVTKPVASRLGLAIVLLAGLGALSLVEHMRQIDAVTTRPWEQWLHASPAVIFGIAISRTASIKHPGEIAAICLSPLIYALYSRFADPGLALTYLIAIPLTTFVFVAPLNPPQRLVGLGALSMGVYVLHGGVLSVMKQILSASSPLLLYSATVVVSFLGAAVLKRVPFIQKVV